MQTEIWAHRGSSHAFIENTLAAFDQAIKDGADGIELDVQRTADGELVVIHDEQLKRLTGANQFLWEVTWPELEQLTLSTKIVRSKKTDAFHAKVPKLEEVLALFKGTNLTVNIELKNSIHLYPGMENEVVHLVNKLAMQDQVLYSSFNHASMKLMSSFVGGEYCGILTSDIQFSPWDYAKEIDVAAYHPMINSLQQPNLVKTCQNEGLKVHVWTADEDAYIYAGLLLGADALITNVPAKAIELRNNFKEDGGQTALEYIKALGISIIE